MPAGKSIQAACMWITVFHGFGGSYTDAKGVPTLNSPAGLRTTKFIVEQLQKISPPGNLTWDFPEMVNACAVGASAQGFMWGGGFSTLLDPGKSVVASDLGWSPTPEAALFGGWGLSVGAASRNIDAAKLFVGWITSKEIFEYRLGAHAWPASAHFGVHRRRGGEEVSPASRDARRDAGQCGQGTCPSRTTGR